MFARKMSVGWRASIVPVPVLPKTTPAAISPITMGGANRMGIRARSGPMRPTATINARVP